MIVGLDACVPVMQVYKIGEKSDSEAFPSPAAEETSAITAVD